jgi:hypothetical protein
LGRYAGQQASEVLAMPRSFREVLREVLREILEAEGGGGSPEGMTRGHGG